MPPPVSSSAACNSKSSDNAVYKAGEQSKDDPFEFVMSTDSVDRMGDIVEQDWSLETFRKNPIALFGHDHDRPIGVWKSVKKQGNRLTGRLELAKRGTSEFIDTLRSLVEQRVLRAVSVGFKPEKSEPLNEKDPWAGFRLSGNTLFECSLVAVPANAEALSLAKSLGMSESARAKLFAKSGGPCYEAACDQLGLRGNAKPKSRASGRGNSETLIENKTMSLADKIEAKRKAVTAGQSTLEGLLTDEVSGDGDIPEEVQTQIDELTSRIDLSNKDLDKLLVAEKALAHRMTDENSARGQHAAVASEPGSTDTVPRITARKNEQKGHRAIAMIATMIKAHVDKSYTPVQLAQAAYKDEPELAHVIKTASAPADMTTDGWAEQLVRDTWAQFLELIYDASIYPRVPGVRLEFDRYGRIKMPVQQGRGQLAGAFVGEGAPIPVKQGTYSSVEMAPKAMKVISSFTKEVAMHSIPQIEGLIRQQILDDTAESLDAAFLDDAARDTVRPAGLQNATATGAGNIVESTGDTVANVIADGQGAIGRLLAARAGNGGAWLIHPLRVLGLSNKQDAASGAFTFRGEISGGSFMGYPFIASQNQPADVVFLIGQQAIAHANDYAPMMDVSDQATLVFDDTAPEHIIDSGTATTMPVKSLFQMDALAVKMTMGLDWLQVRPDAVQVLTSVSW